MSYISDRTGAEVDQTLDDADSHHANTSNPHSVTATQVGLGNVDNTSDTNKPVSTATQTELDDLQAQINALGGGGGGGSNVVEIGVALSDETTALEVGSNKIRIRVPCALTITDLRASVNTAPLGAAIEIDILVDPEESSGGSIFASGSALVIDAGERTSETNSAPYDLEIVNIPDDSELTFDLNQIGNIEAGTGLKVWIIGTRT